MHILVAETDRDLLAEVKRALEAGGHEVSVANDGMEAWSYLAGDAPPDLLVTRLHLGAGSPPGTALGMRAQSHIPRIPVVYIPSNAERARLVEPDHGAVLVKPFSAAELLATIQQLIRLGIAQ